ncbi:hypothetical protein [Streptomyces physcomitrii]|uniref:Uncharacterized protein n=1 Tax=Streptomyces physcomitrii TaxID=2724184 RepID=A0ABX1H5I8_9ACTN|nr:hypothetical protein [Streptomyces physcomitrii]NKI43308.1 hypothetical protein [Streptomyces physcomitrii]
MATSHDNDDTTVHPDNIHVTDAPEKTEAKDKPRAKKGKGEADVSTDNIHVTTEPAH